MKSLDHLKMEITELFPDETSINSKGHFEIGDVDLVDLANQYGTPLYIYDENTIKNICHEFIHSFRKYWKDTHILYAAKAFINKPLAQLMMSENLGLDIVSGGELAVAQSVQFPPSSIYFHGNNKSKDEISMALDYKIGRFVVDNFAEIELLTELCQKKNVVQDVLLRLSPGIDAHTHVKTTTGILDSKFGFSIVTGDAMDAVTSILKSKNLNLIGFHCHLGSPIFELEPYKLGIESMMEFISSTITMGVDFKEFSPGGGFAIRYLKTDKPPQVESYAKLIVETIVKECSKYDMSVPKIVIEAGRAIVGRAGVALYRVGSTKDIPNVRKYVSLDGGMGDNIRPSLYGSKYQPYLVNRVAESDSEKVTLSGKFCESGDILVEEAVLPQLHEGDLIALPASGAYSPAMASNYNLNPKPPIVLIAKNGTSKLIRKGETYDDLMSFDVL